MVFLRKLTGGGFLTIDYCSRTIGCCFPYCFMQIFVGDKALMEEEKVVTGGISPSTKENPDPMGEDFKFDNK